MPDLVSDPQEDLLSAAVDAINIFCRSVLVPRGLLSEDAWGDRSLLEPKYQVAERVARGVLATVEHAPGVLLGKDGIIDAIDLFCSDVLVARGLLPADAMVDPSLRKERDGVADTVVEMQKQYLMRVGSEGS